MLLLIAFYPQYSSAFFHTNQMNNPLYGNFGSASSSLYSNPSSLYGSNFGTIYGGGLGGLGMNNGFGMMMPGFGYGTPSFGSGGGIGGLSDVFSGLLGLGSSLSNQGFGSNYNFDYGYESNYDNNLDYALQPNNNDDIVSFGGYDSNYGSNSDFDYDNEFQSDVPLEDLRSFNSSMDEQQYSFQDDYDFSQTPLDDFSSNPFQ